MSISHIRTRLDALKHKYAPRSSFDKLRMRRIIRQPATIRITAAHHLAASATRPP